MRVYFLVFIVSVFLIGCSQGPTQGVESVTNGDGLEVRFSLTERFLPVVEYELKLKNTGKEAVEITPDNFQFRTNPVLGGTGIFREEDVQEMLNTVFDRGSIILPYGQERVIRGTLQIKDSYFQDLSQESFEVILSIEYNYETDFSNNLNLDFERFSVNSDRISQAAPVVLDRIDLFAEDSETFYLLYYIRDKNRGQQRIELDNYEILLGTSYLSCSAFSIRRDGSRARISSTPFIDSTSPELLLSCPVPQNMVQTQPYNTITSGSFSYDYSLQFRDVINLPRDRNSLVR